MADTLSTVVNVEDVDEIEHLEGDHYGGFYKPLTPGMKPRGGKLGVNLSRVPPGRTTCPFHWHQFEDEVFYILSGTGVLRYGDELSPIKPGDCISCPAGTQVAHQMFNSGDEDLIYLSIGPNDPNEIAGYPDSGKIMVRTLRTVGHLEKTAYMADEPDPPKIRDLAAGER